MQKILVILIVLIQFTSCVSVKKHNEQIATLHTPDVLRNDVDRVYFQLKKHHPKLYQYISKTDLDFKFDSLKQSIKTRINSRDFYKKLAPVISEVKQGHVALGSASKHFTKRDIKALKELNFEFNKLEFDYINDKLWVLKTRGKDSMVVGSEVLKIENEQVSKLIKTYKTRFASDGYNQTLHNRYVGPRFTSFYYKDKGYIDSLKVHFKLKDSVFVKLYKRISKEDKEKKNDSLVKKKVVKPSKEEKQKQRLRAKNKRKKNRRQGYIASKNEYTRNFNFIGTDSATAYMKIRGFNNGNYRKFYKESFKKLDSAKTKNFILDLRDNGGGRIAEINYLYSYLTKNNYTFMAASQVNSRTSFLPGLVNNSKSVSGLVFGVLATPFVAIENLLKTKKQDENLYYKFPYTKEKQPNKLNYKANLYVLINGNSFSASALLSTHLKATKRAFFVGEETGGAYNGCVAGLYKIYELPESKLKVRMGLMQIEAPYKQNPDGFGIKPDKEILPTINDLLTDKDPELDWILDDISKN
ncbi:S41 family peptidase [Algibacter miyuki]|uniref:S41 family peptidase n=1 Tax=Algibacter miyuki TaxID=1306933 RepID=A0ABV5H0L4_9FLAO|nr:S41 family peptidase [Algibacter miyuki]MDN3667498.1 S41 family peptidase [Algibacter miyuki]